MITFPHVKTVSLQLLRAPRLWHKKATLFESQKCTNTGNVTGCMLSITAGVLLLRRLVFPSFSACEGSGPHLMLLSLARRSWMEARGGVRKWVWFPSSVHPPTTAQSAWGLTHNGQGTKACLMSDGSACPSQSGRHLRLSYQGLRMSAVHRLPDCQRHVLAPATVHNIFLGH